MKLVYTLLLFNLVAAGTAISQNASFIDGEIEQISPCGLSCLAHTVPDVGCSLTNITCQCASARLVQTTSDCMMANCTLAEALNLSKIQATICDLPYQSQNKKIRILTITCAIITNGSAFIRFVTRISLSQTLGFDDWFIAAAVLTDAVFLIYGVQLEKNGLGDHIWTINVDSITNLFYWFYICESIYILTMGLIKTSIIFFYLRVFPRKSLRVACWGTMVFCGSSTVAFVLVTTFQCHPIVYTWDKNIKGGHCVNYNSVAWAQAALNIFQDIMILLLPMHDLRHLKLNKKKKVGMYAMFGVGGFVCIISMIRLYSLRTFGLTADPTWENIPTTFWSTLESTSAIFCACMPAIRAGLVALFPKVMGSTSHAVSLGVESRDGLNPASHGGFDSKPVRLRSVEEPEQQCISLSPWKPYPETNQAVAIKTPSFAGTAPTPDAATANDTKCTKLTISKPSLSTATTSTRPEYDKPLPLPPPRPTISVLLSLVSIPSTETDDPKEHLNSTAKFPE